MIRGNVMRRPSLVIRLAPDDGARAIQLLREHEACDLGRQCPGSEREPRRRASLGGLAEAVRATDHEGHGLRLLATTLQPLRKLLRGHRRTTELAGNDVRSGRYRGGETLAFALADLLHRERSTGLLANLLERHWPVSGGPRFVFANRRRQSRISRL